MTSLQRKVAIGASVILLVTLAVLGHFISSRKSLERFKAELRAKGERLTYAELPRPQQTNGTPNFDKLVHACGFIPKGVINPGNIDCMSMTNPGEAPVVWKAPALNTGKKTAEISWKELDKAVTQVQAQLREMRQGLQTVEVDRGSDSTNFLGGVRNDFVVRRKVAYWLAGAAINDLHQHRIDSAMGNLQSLMALVRLHENERTLINQMVCIGTAGVALNTTWEVLQYPDLTDAQLARIQADLQTFDLLDGLEKGMEGERALGQEAFAKVRETKTLNMFYGKPSTPMERFGLSLWSTSVAAEDERFYLEIFQSLLQEVRKLRNRSGWGEVKKGCEAVLDRIDEDARSWQKVKHFFSMQAIPNCARAIESGAHTETQRQMTIAAVAIQRYKLRHGKPPPDLNAFVSEFLAQPPIDWMDGKVLRYKSHEDGTFLLYSVGDDGIDGGGSLAKAKPRQDGRAVLGLWSTADAVWPMPVK